LFPCYRRTAHLLLTLKKIKVQKNFQPKLVAAPKMILRDPIMVGSFKNCVGSKDLDDVEILILGSSLQAATKTSSDSKSRHDKHHRDGKRERDRQKEKESDRYRSSKIKRASIGIQCRRDKTLDKVVGFEGQNSHNVDFTKSSEPNSNRCFAGYSMANPCYHLGNKYKYGHLMRVEVHPNGGAKVLHLWNDEIEPYGEKEVENIAKDFVKVNYGYNICDNI